jgi:hypothetical protein
MAFTTSAAYASSFSQARPADTSAYAAGDVISNSTSAPVVLTFANAGPTYGSAIIQTVSLRVDVSTVPAGYGSFRLHLYNAAPTAINDNAAYNLPSGDRSKYQGFVELSTPLDLGDTLWSQADYVGKQVRLLDGNLYGILETRGAFTPTSGASKTISLFTVEAGR